jgi:hypothetical protein
MTQHSLQSRVGGSRTRNFEVLKCSDDDGVTWLEVN